MKRFVAAASLFALSVLGAHGLAFILLRALPDPAIAALGIQSAQQEARAAFGEEKPTRSYGRVIADLAQGDLGTTLDGVSARSELSEAAIESLPRLALATGFTCLIIVAVAYAPRRLLPAVASFGSLLSFMPPFVAPFIGLGALLAMGGGGGGPGADLLVIICLAAPAAAFAAAQAAAITARNLSLPFAVMLRAIGATRIRQRTRLLRSLAVELAPSLEKLGVGLFTSLLFVESIFGTGGLGTLMLRAVRRNDTDMVLALVLILALTINLLRILAVEIRRQHGVSQS